MPQCDKILNEVIRSAAIPLDDTAPDYTELLQSVKDKDFILLGEASHGTHEFYAARVEISKQLILEHGLTAIAVEGDWPSAERVNRFIRWQGVDVNANEALSDFKRFPLWMWRNTVMLDFVIWLREHNQDLPTDQQVGFYGLDMYSMYESIAAVLEYLDQVDPEAGAKARERYECLDHTSNERDYGYGVILGQRPSCEDEVVEQLLALRERSMTYGQAGDPVSEDEHFKAEQNARLVHSAEGYYRQMFDPRVNTWNLRDNHMIETLDNLHRHLSERIQHPAKIAVWEHNSHLGDARATYMAERGQHNVGQLARERYGDRCAIIGFTTYTGNVTAASNWDGPAQRKRVRPALQDSIEQVLHCTDLQQFYLPLKGDVAQHLRKPRLERAIGVLYLPESERASHYFHCVVPDQFDGIVHFDETHALEPLDASSQWVKGEAATFPYNV